MTDAPDHVSSLLACGEPPAALQHHVVARGSDAQKLALAHNRALDRGLWFELYRPGARVELAEALCWRPLDTAQLDHVVFVARERRPRPLSALVAAHRGKAIERLARVDAGEFGSRAASVLVTSDGLPAEFERQLATRALWRDAVLAVLRDHRKFTDDEIVEALGGRWAMPGAMTPIWPGLIGVLVDRPNVRDRLAGAAERVMVLGYYLPYAGLEGSGQLAFVEAAVGHLANEYGHWETYLGELFHHPRTTDETAAAIREVAEGHGALRGDRAARLYDSLDRWRGPVVPRGTDPATSEDPAVHRALLDDAMAWARSQAIGEIDERFEVSIWALALLAANPHLGADDRAQLTRVLSHESVRAGLSGCANAARWRAENPQLPLAPAYNYTTESGWRRRTRLERRLGPVAGIVYHHGYDDERARAIPLRRLADEMEATGAMDLLCHRFGEDLVKWETAFELMGVLASTDNSNDMGAVVDATEAIVAPPDA